ncbi:hypothetical protein HanXRQr2_Chr03g0090321 [Helianthus annuus]|uniref:Uncharacterized protein n=1 Tax=Helianthus annuus TaxID=4232 RepID=A0A9K3JD39_HELAN|nr:hypothetical protein HanXRQr2_Chr03g0090321 [Helianthus annuus]
MIYFQILWKLELTSEEMGIDMMRKMTTGDGDRSTGVFAFSLFFRLLILNNH